MRGEERKGGKQGKRSNTTKTRSQTRDGVKTGERKQARGKRPRFAYLAKRVEKFDLERLWLTRHAVVQAAALQDTPAAATQQQQCIIISSTHLSVKWSELFT